MVQLDDQLKELNLKKNTFYLNILLKNKNFNFKI